MSVANVLRAEGLTKSFAGFVALNGVSIGFERGRLTAIIGPNGAGKSTFFNLLAGALRPTKGRLLYEERDITGQPQHAFAGMGIAKSFQITNVFPHLSAFENVRVAVQAMRTRYDLWRPKTRYGGVAEQAYELLAKVGIHRQRNNLARDMAHGEQRCLEVAIALACRPRVLLLDEPTAGMSPEETRLMIDLIVQLAVERTVVLVEHKMKVVMGICERLVVLHQGELLAEGTPAEIRANEDVKRVYLGQGAH